MSIRSTLLAGTALALLCGCMGGSPSASTEKIPYETARTGIESLLIYTAPPRQTLKERPSAPLGIYTSMYLGQLSAFLPSRTALQGIGSQIALLKGQSDATSDETFALLKEFGATLAVDIVDALNRSTNRVEALNAYTATLKDLYQLSQRKREELTAQLEQIQDQRDEQRKVVRDLERKERDAIRAKDYGSAADAQKELAPAKGELAETEARMKQIQEVQDIYEDLLGIAEERVQAIELNREILIAGLRVVEIPGIDDLGILEQGRRNRNSIFLQ